MNHFQTAYTDELASILTVRALSTPRTTLGARFFLGGFKADQPLSYLRNL